ncbi:replication initiator protein [Peromfec virus RodF7_15]|uniref:Replication initiator protein n=1 Tax=Peromfec virus RodF7_15 TaxID=2929350 RepID=A0A976N2B9_9VIRU|nr:replication initiator protein [Peromfec virus RodF7_15]
MTCYYPLVALDNPHYKERKGNNRLQIVGSLRNKLDLSSVHSFDEPIDRLERLIYKTVDCETGEIYRPVLIPCGKCIGCRLEKSRNWAIRCSHEAQMVDSSYFITLTYNDYQMPSNSSLDKKHVFEFIKNFRYKFGKDIKYFLAGEYGTLSQRPHYHLILFNVQIPDLEYFKKCNCNTYYTSGLVSDIWKKGYVIIGDVTFESAAYVARYVTKKQYGEQSYDYYGKRIPEFQLQSLRPGIGYSFFKKYYHDIYDHYDKVVCSNGLHIKPPRYYDKLLEIENPALYDKIKNNRLKKSREMIVDNLRDERLFAKETIQNARFQRLIRVYDSFN